MKKNRILALLLAAAMSISVFLPAYANETESVETNAAAETIYETEADPETEIVVESVENSVEEIETEAIVESEELIESEVEEEPIAYKDGLPESLQNLSGYIENIDEIKDQSKDRGTSSSDQIRATSYGEVLFNYDIWGVGFLRGQTVNIGHYVDSFGRGVTAPYLIAISDEDGNLVDYYEGEFTYYSNQTYKTYKWTIPYSQALGTYYIFAFASEDEITDVIEIVVTNKEVPVTGIELTPEELTMSFGDAVLLGAGLIPYGATTQCNMTWEVSDTSVATISKLPTRETSGRIVKAVGYGSCIITVKQGKNLVAKCEVYVPDPSLPFKDVAASKWYYNAVKWAYNTGLITGTSDNTFSPNDPMTRGMLVTVLYRGEGRPSVSGTNKFPDVIKGKYYEKGVVWASSLDIVSGYTNGKFGPDDSITREQLAKVLYRYVEYKGFDVTGKTSLSGFNDADDVSGYAKRYMEWAVAEGLIKGSNGNLNPKGNATRAEIAAILKRLSEKYNSSAVIQ